MKQKVWLITGASKGLGLEIANAALAAGDLVVAAVRRIADHTVAGLGNSDRAMVVAMDVTNHNEVSRGIDAAVRRFNRIDVVVNNAGYGLLAATEEASDEEVRKQYDTNVFGMLNVIRAILPQLRKQSSGYIINISSLYGYLNNIPGLGLYGSTKFAVEGISEGLATELKPLGIHVTAVAPGLFRTGFASTESYQRAANTIIDYDGTVGKVRSNLSRINGNQPGDPAKLAAIIIKLAASENPPLHLPVGSDSFRALRKKIALISDEMGEWESISKCTDHV